MLVLFKTDYWNMSGPLCFYLLHIHKSDQLFMHKIVKVLLYIFKKKNYQLRKVEDPKSMWHLKYSTFTDKNQSASQ